MTQVNILYYVGHKASAKSNSWLAVTNDKEEAVNLSESLAGASVVVEKQYDYRWRLINGSN